jgi:thiamine transport system substrate-binding protein
MPGQSGRVFVAVALAVVVAVAGYGLYAYASGTTNGGEPTLVVYTYPSLFSGTNDTAAVFQTVFGGFEASHHVHIDVEYPPGTLVGTLLAEQNAPNADLVIGLDEVTAPQAERFGLLVPYAPPALADVPTNLTDEIAPDDSVVPYEWGYLAIDYNDTFYNATHGAVANLSFDAIAANQTWASNLLVEDPTVDITGEEFLLWEMEFQEHVAHQNWTTFWQAVDPHLQVANDWGTAFDEFSTPPDPPGMVVSYASDPAYEAYYNSTPTFGSTVAHANGTAYGWKSIYGIGIVAGTRHLTLDEEFENWFLSGTVQSEIPTNEWEYPANDTTALPPEYAAALPPSGITPLNGDVTPASVAANLTTWLDEWQTIDNNAA